MQHHLHTMIGYTIRATDGDIGQVKDFIVDDENRVIQYLVVGTGNLPSGRKMMLPTAWISIIDWNDAGVHLDRSLELAVNNPEFAISKKVLA